VERGLLQRTDRTNAAVTRPSATAALRVLAPLQRLFPVGQPHYQISVPFVCAIGAGASMPGRTQTVRGLTRSFYLGESLL
jgi:hypothetical protein